MKSNPILASVLPKNKKRQNAPLGTSCRSFCVDLFPMGLSPVTADDRRPRPRCHCLPVQSALPQKAEDLLQISQILRADLLAAVAATCVGKFAHAFQRPFLEQPVSQSSHKGIPRAGTVYRFDRDRRHPDLFLCSGQITARFAKGNGHHPRSPLLVMLHPDLYTSVRVKSSSSSRCVPRLFL